MDKNSDVFKKYAVTEEYLVEHNMILIIGAAGNWGSHFAAGMAMAAHADLLLVEAESHENEVKALTKEIEGYGLGNQVQYYIAGESELADRKTFVESMKEKYGAFAAIMDVEGINTYGIA